MTPREVSAAIMGYGGYVVDPSRASLKWPMMAAKNVSPAGP